LTGRAGLDRAEVDHLLDELSVEGMLAEAAREAHGRGAFGVPTLFLGERMYWGNDRLVLLEHDLRRALEVQSP